MTNVFYEGRINYCNGRFYWGYVVELFFVISGFVTYRYIAKIEKGLSFEQFITRRAGRLLPLVAVSAIFYEVILFFYVNILGKTWFGINVTLFGTLITTLGIQDGWVFSNPCVNNPVWYISVLLLCYVVFYVVTKAHKHLPVHYLYLLIVLIGCGTLQWGINLPFLNSSSARGYYAFFTGLLLAMAKNKLKVSTRVKHVIAILCWCYVIVFPILIWKGNDLVERDLVFNLTFVYYPALIIAIQSGFAKKIFGHPIWGRIGKFQYDVFIWHNPLYLVMYLTMEIFSFTINFQNRWTMFAYCAVSEIVGLLSYYILEKPLHRLVQKGTNALLASNTINQ